MAEDKLPSSTDTPFASATEQERTRPDDFYTFYANNISVTFSSWDISLIFGEITGQKDGKPVVEEIAKVIMTREFAKVVARLLAANLVAYEKQFGEIKSPHFTLIGEPAVADFDRLSASPSTSPSASVSPSTSASPSPEAEDEE